MTPKKLSAVIANISPLPRSHWAVVTFPSKLSGHMENECSFHTKCGRVFRAVRGHTRGCKDIWRVFVSECEGNQRFEGDLVNAPHRDAGPLEYHDWVTDDLKALFPKFAVQVDGKIYESQTTKLELIEESAAHHRWELRFEIPMQGIIIEWWADILHNDPVIPVWGKVTWSNRQDSAMSKRFEFLGMSSGELVFLDFADRHGVLPPVSKNKEHIRFFNDLPITLQDGAALPLSGSMLAFKQAAESGAPDVDMDSIHDLVAATHGPVVGVCKNWDGYFLANQQIPRLSEDYVSDAQSSWEQWYAQLDQRVGWFAAREFVCAKTPGQTGNQPDFGATKGTYAVTEHDPRYIYRMQYAVQSDLFRGTNHYEDGRPLEASRHPNWVTWNLQTHYSASVSPDRLGKTPGFNVTNGWNSYDDQHYSVNTIAAYMALTDDPLMDSHVLHMAAPNLAAYRVRYPEYGVGAARAQGRTAHALANLMSVSETGVAALYQQALDVRLQFIKEGAGLEVVGPMKHLHRGNPDGRKQVYQNGELAQWVSMWEHGLALVGLYATWKHTRDAELWDTVYTVAETLAEFGCFRDKDGDFYYVADVAYAGGEHPIGWADPFEKAQVCELFPTGVTTWTFAGLVAAREILGTNHILSEKLNSAIGKVAPADLAADDHETAEWWATVMAPKL